MAVSRRTAIVTPADSRLLASRETFKMGPLRRDGDQDEYIDFLLASKSAAFEQACGRVFARETIRDDFRIDHGPSHADTPIANALLLSRVPVVSITSVTLHSGPLDPTLYEIDDDTGKLTRLHACGDGRFVARDWRGGTVSVVYEAGYILPGTAGRNLPQDIEESVLTLMRMAFKAKDRDPALRSQSTGEVGNQSFWLGMPPDVQAVIDSYRVVSLG